MRYTRDTTLLPLSPAELRLAEKVQFSALPAPDLLLFDEGVSDFFFEFEPEQDIERFLQHAHFACMADGRLLACREDLFSVAARQAGRAPPKALVVDLGVELPRPLRFSPVRRGFAAIGGGGDWRGMLTLCSCGIAGCFSQYAWVRESLCVALFTINGACLTEVEWLSFRFEIRA
jgi:hypothetical protein